MNSSLPKVTPIPSPASKNLPHSQPQVQNPPAPQRRTQELAPLTPCQRTFVFTICSFYTALLAYIIIYKKY